MGGLEAQGNYKELEEVLRTFGSCNVHQGTLKSLMSSKELFSALGSSGEL